VRQLHASLAAHAPEQLITILQESGYAAGPGLYNAFAAEHNPTDLDADRPRRNVVPSSSPTAAGALVSMSPVGDRRAGARLERLGGSGAGNGHRQPMCFFSAGMLADFLGRLSDEDGGGDGKSSCRSRGDERCRFLSATPDVLEKVYNEMTAGRTYEEALKVAPYRRATLTPIQQQRRRPARAQPTSRPFPNPPMRLSRS